MMAAGNPNWWSINTTTMQQSHESSPPPPHASHEYFYGSNSSTADHHHHHSNNQDFPRSWSQLLLGGGGLGGSELQERFVSSSPFQYKKLEEEGEKWEDQILNPSSSSSVVVDLIKQESVAPTTTNYDDQFHGSNYTNTHSWSPLIMPPPPLSSSSSSVVTSLSTSLLNFSGTATQSARRNNNNSYHHLPPDQNSSECISSSAGGVLKKPKIQHSSSTQPILKVRKEKLGDRITALHQLVSPFGKTDTASVLSEAIGYIRFLQAQIEALSSPYMGNVSAAGSMGHQPQSEESLQDLPNDLRTRGLCLVPVSCTQQIGSETGADYWAPALGGGF